MAPTASQVQAVERLVHESVRRVDALAPSALRSLLPVLQAARDEMRADLQGWLDKNPDGAERFTAYQRTQLLHSLETTFDRIAEMDPAMARVMAQGRKETGPLAVANLELEVQRLSSIFGGGMVTLPQIDTAAVIAEGNRLLWKRHERSAKRYADGVGDDIKLRLGVSLAKGETFAQAVQRLRGSRPFQQSIQYSDRAALAHGCADDMFHRWRHWGDRLVRTEMMHAYNVQHDESIRHVNEIRAEEAEEYLRRWDATADKTACVRCRDLDRTVATLEGTFKGGIKSPPLHPYCRCVVLAWLARWGNMKGEVPSKADDGSDIRPKPDRPKAKPQEHKPDEQPKELPQRGKPIRDSEVPGKTVITDSEWSVSGKYGGQTITAKKLVADSGMILDEKGRRIGGVASLWKSDTGDGKIRVHWGSARDGVSYGGGARSKDFDNEADALAYARSSLEKHGLDLRRKVARSGKTIEPSKEPIKPKPVEQPRRPEAIAITESEWKVNENSTAGTKRMRLTAGKDSILIADLGGGRYRVEGMAARIPRVFDSLDKARDLARSQLTAKATQTAKRTANAEAKADPMGKPKEREALAKRLVVPMGTANTADVRVVVAQLSKLPLDALREIEAGGVKVIASRDNVTNAAPNLRGVRPRGWPPGSSWENVPGMYSGSTKHVVVCTRPIPGGKGREVYPTGTGPKNAQHGCESLTAHEAGHALDAVRGKASAADPAFIAAYKSDLKAGKLREYFKQPGDAGAEEAYAESFSVFVAGDKIGRGSEFPATLEYWRSKYAKK